MHSLISCVKKSPRLFQRYNMSSSVRFPVTEAIKRKLENELQPQHLEVINESHMHKVPKDSETHFKVVIVSGKFETMKSPIERHRIVNSALKDELDGPVHALSIVAKSPTQWAVMQENGVKISPSPKCRGGDGTFQS